MSPTSYRTAPPRDVTAFAIRERMYTPSPWGCQQKELFFLICLYCGSPSKRGGRDKNKRHTSAKLICLQGVTFPTKERRCPCGENRNRIAGLCNPKGSVVSATGSGGVLDRMSSVPALRGKRASDTPLPPLPLLSERPVRQRHPVLRVCLFRVKGLKDAVAHFLLLGSLACARRSSAATALAGFAFSAS